MRESAAKVLENGSFLHDKSPSAIWAKQVAALIHALPLPSAAEAASPNQESKTMGAANLAECWYLGSMNDGLFIINKPPRPSTDDVWHDRPDGPTLVLALGELSGERAQAIIDAHNATGAASPAAGWRPIETAPKDGTVIVLFARCKTATASIPVIGHWDDERGEWIELTFSPNVAVGLVALSWMPRPKFSYAPSTVRVPSPPTTERAKP